jgi:hypothetical protein
MSESKRRRGTKKHDRDFEQLRCAERHPGLPPLSRHPEPIYGAMVHVPFGIKNQVG